MAYRKALFESIAAGKHEWGATFSDCILKMTWTASKGWTPPEIVPSATLSLSPAAMVFHYGMSVFEGLKAFPSGSGPPRMFRPDLNIQRLNTSARRMALPTIDPDTMMSALQGFVHDQAGWVPKSPYSSLYLRPTLIGTDPKIGVRHSNSALLYVLAAPNGAFFSSTDGVRLLADSSVIRAWPGGVGNCKTGGNYGLSIAPARAAQERGFDQMLWLSDCKRRLVGECGMMNAMFVYSGDGASRIVTPRLDGTILPGITRQSILELAPGLGIGIEERDMPIEEVLRGFEDGSITEAFGTGTAAVITPIRSITVDGVEHVVKGDGKVAGLMKRTLTNICYSEEPHPWMIPARKFAEEAAPERKVSGDYL